MLKREENIGNRAKKENPEFHAHILMDDDWDLHAVVRGCAALVTTTTVSTTNVATTTDNHSPSFPASNLPFHDDQNPFDFPDLIEDRNDSDLFQGLQEIYQEFCGDDPLPSTTAAVSVASNTSTIPVRAAHVFQLHEDIMQVKPPPQMNMQIQENVQFNNSRFGSSPQNFPDAVPPPIRQRRRKNQRMKMVRQMTQEELSADSWAWRKYGQKPIKGSPYPRNYYQCSTSKGCAARKQVERSPSDPGIFVVSYTGKHAHPRPTHRSLFAGSNRSKFAPPPAVATKNDDLLFRKRSISSSSPASGSSFSSNTPSMEGEAAAQNDDVEMAEQDEGARDDDDDDNIIMIPNDLMNDDDDDDMFKGFQDSDHSSGGGGDLSSSGVFSSPPWSATSYDGNAAIFSGGECS